MEKLKELERKFATIPRNELLSKIVATPKDKRANILIEAAKSVGFSDIFPCLEHISTDDKVTICTKIAQTQTLSKAQFQAIWTLLTKSMFIASEELCVLIDSVSLVWDKTMLTDLLTPIYKSETRVGLIKHFIAHVPAAELTGDHLEMCSEEYQRLLLPLVMKHVTAREEAQTQNCTETKKRKVQESCRHVKTVPDTKFPGDYSFTNYVSGEQVTFRRVVCVGCNSTLVVQTFLYTDDYVNDFVLCDTSFQEQCPHPRQALVILEADSAYHSVMKPITSIYIQLPTFVHSSKFQFFSHAKCQFCGGLNLPVVNYGTKDDPWVPCFEWEVHRSLQIHTKKSKKK